MPLNLDQVVARLAGLEEAILMKLLDRCQFAYNEAAYTPGISGFDPPESATLLELRLLHQETVDALFGRYLVPEERPFYTGLPRPRRLVTTLDPELHIRELETINLSGRILISYLELLPQICKPGSDGHLGSSVEHDVICLQAIARRIHYAACYVAESKYRLEPAVYQELIDRQDEKSLMERLTRKEVEQEVLRRVERKIRSLQKASDPNNRIIIAAEPIVYYFRDWIIPLTKEGEVRYLMQRR